MYYKFEDSEEKGTSSLNYFDQKLKKWLYFVRPEAKCAYLVQIRDQIRDKSIGKIMKKSFQLLWAGGAEKQNYFHIT